MRAGKLRRRLQVQQRTSGTNTEGRPQENWPTLFSVWAAVEPLSAPELLLAAQAGVEITHQVTTRYQAALAGPTAHDLRFVEGSRVLEVVSQPIDEAEGHRTLLWQCRELLEG